MIAIGVDGLGEDAAEGGREWQGFGWGSLREERLSVTLDVARGFGVAYRRHGLIVAGIEKKVAKQA